jgi:hypothetical protein
MNIVPPIEAESLPLWSPDGIAHIRDTAKTAHYPRNKIDPLLAAAIEQTRKTHVAKSQGDSKTAAKADLERLKLFGLIEEELDRAADTVLSMLALAFERRHHELIEFLVKILSVVPVIGGILDRLTTIERIFAAGVHQ